jgi:hypothetical protein
MFLARLLLFLMVHGVPSVSQYTPADSRLP